MTKGLVTLRAAIDELDRRIVSLLGERGELVRQVAALKIGEADVFSDPQRELEILQDVVRVNPGPLSADAIVSIFREILARNRELVADAGVTHLRVQRRAGEADRVVTVGTTTLGGDRQFIAGPCAVEGEAMLEETARALASAGVRLLRGGAFKPRTSPYAFQGLGEPALRLLREVADRHGMAVVTEVIDTRDVALVARYADLLQVGARNMYNYPLLKELGACGKPVLLKRAFSATIEELLLSAEYVLAHGNDQVILCERGIRTFERETRHTLDLSAVPILRTRTALPVVVDVSHAAGRRDILPDLTAAAFAAGACAVMLEVHPTPAAAASDGAQQLCPADFLALVETVRGRFRELLEGAKAL